jgi:hypothetical protein
MAERRITTVLSPATAATVPMLLLAPAGQAAKAPSLASSAQYKAFVEYVKKMEERSSQPTSAETKNQFEAKLTAKKSAAAHKANALQIRALRAQKSQAAPGQAKEKIQERIERIMGEIKANLEDEKAKRKQLKGAVEKKRAAIEAEAKVAEKAEETVKKIDRHWNKAYEEEKAALNATRESRLGYLEQKLEQGRAAVAAMPSTG